MILVWIILGAAVVFLAVRAIVVYPEYAERMRILKVEIGRTHGNEKKHYRHERRRLIREFFFFMR